MEENAELAVARPRMLALARESRSITQGELAATMTGLGVSGGTVSQGYVSRAEAGRLAVTGDRLELYARALDYPPRLLCLGEREVGAGPGLVFHRKKQAVSATDMRRIHALLNLTRIQVRALLPGAPRPAKCGIPHIRADDYNSAEDAARRLRAEWAVPAGPVDSVVWLVEAAGGLIACRDLVAPMPLDSGPETVPVDAVSACPPGEDAVVLLNTGTPAERQRFTLAHELAHMVMHSVPHPEQEKQANRFAAELLMPASQIRTHLDRDFGLPRLLELKAEWRVSMWALLRRAHSLGGISDWQYRTLAVEMSSLGYRTSEPATFEPEVPTAVTGLVNWHLEQGRDVDDLAYATCLKPDEFVRLYLRPSVPAKVDSTGRAISPTSREEAT